MLAFLAAANRAAANIDVHVFVQTRLFICLECRQEWNAGSGHNSTFTSLRVGAALSPQLEPLSLLICFL